MRPKTHYTTHMPRPVKAMLAASAENQRTGGVNGAVSLILDSLGAAEGDSAGLGFRIAEEVLLRHARVIPHMRRTGPGSWERVGLVLHKWQKAAIEEAAVLCDVGRGFLIGHLLVGLQDEFEHRIASARNRLLAQGRYEERSRGGYPPPAVPPIGPFA